MHDNKLPRMMVDGRWVEFTPGLTILEAAASAGIGIPTLCYYNKSGHCDVCRICVVEVDGSDRLVPSCSTHAREGMEVWTDTQRVMMSRRRTIDMLLASGRHNCIACEANGDCRLQDLAYTHGSPAIDNLPPAESFPAAFNDPFIMRDYSKCILCGRCVAACNEVQVHNAIPDPYGRREGRPQGWFPLPDPSNCKECGECVDACPVGALTEKNARGCGRPWETIKTDTTCPYCGVGCTLRIVARDGRVVKVTSAGESGTNGGSLCVKGRFGYEFVNSPERLKKPLIRTNAKDAERPEFREAGWDEALALIAEKFKAARADNPDSFGAFASARCTNEENYYFQKFARAVMGTNNVDHCARLCHASTVSGLAMSFGSGAMTNSIKDLAEDADVYFVIGSNTTEAHPVIGMKLKQAVRHRDAKVLLADPRGIELADHAALWIRQKPGTDVALINGLMNVIITEGLENKEFINSRTENYAEFVEAVRGFTPEMAADITGIPADKIREAARMIASAGALSIVYSMGITQHTTGVDNVVSLANLAMLTGQIGRPGAGVNPLRGQNNVQGACDMGSLPGDLPGYQKVWVEEARGKFETAWGVTLRDKAGFTVTEMMDEIYAKRIRTLYVMGENPMLSDPDVNHVKKALAKLDFMVVQDIFLTETAHMADVVLPAASWAEKDGTFTNTERRVQLIRAAIPCIGESKADWEIIKSIAVAMGEGDKFGCESAVGIFGEMSKLTPSYAGMDYARLDAMGGLCWPCPTKDHKGTPILHTEKFTRGLGKFHAVGFRPPAESPDAEYPIVLTTGRILQHYHTGTMTRKVAGLNHIVPEALLELNPYDAMELGIQDGEMVKVASRRGEITIRAKMTIRVAKGEVFIPFHFVEASANVLTAANLDPIAKIPEFKVSAVRVSKIV